MTSFRVTRRALYRRRLGIPDGRVIGGEVKAGATLRTEDLADLRNLANHLGDRIRGASPVLQGGVSRGPAVRPGAAGCPAARRPAGGCCRTQRRGACATRG